LILNRISIAVAILLLQTWSVQSRDDLERNAELNCFVKQLKSLKVLNERFQGFVAKRNQTLDCETFLKASEKAIIGEIDDGTSKDQRTAKFKDCIMTDLKDKNVFAEYMTLKVYEAASSLSEDEKKQKRSEILTKLGNMRNNANKLCGVYEKIYGDEFDKITENDGKEKSKIEELTADYCMTKKIIENKLLNGFYFVLNTKNIDTDKIDCKDVLERNRKDFELNKLQEFKTATNKQPAASDEIAKCEIEKYQKFNVFDKYVVLFHLSTTNAQAEQKAPERKRFIDFMTELELSDC
jgi:hypothetical protein